jgi:hypothetical protein
MASSSLNLATSRPSLVTWRFKCTFSARVTDSSIEADARSMRAALS